MKRSAEEEFDLMIKEAIPDKRAYVDPFAATIEALVQKKQEEDAAKIAVFVPFPAHILSKEAIAAAAPQIVACMEGGLKEMVLRYSLNHSRSYILVYCHKRDDTLQPYYKSFPDVQWWIDVCIWHNKIRRRTEITHADKINEYMCMFSRVIREAWMASHGEKSVIDFSDLSITVKV